MISSSLFSLVVQIVYPQLLPPANVFCNELRSLRNPWELQRYWHQNGFLLHASSKKMHKSHDQRHPASIGGDLPHRLCALPDLVCPCCAIRWMSSSPTPRKVSRPSRLTPSSKGAPGLR